MHDVVSVIIHLQRYGKDDGNIRLLPVIESVEGKKEWEVEEILDHRLVKEKKEYLVRWKGYFEDETSWEPPEHLENSQQLLLKFIADYPESATIEHFPLKSRSRCHKKVGEGSSQSQPDLITMLYTPATSLRCRLCDSQFHNKRSLFAHLYAENHFR